MYKRTFYSSVLAVTLLCTSASPLLANTTPSGAPRAEVIFGSANADHGGHAYKVNEGVVQVAYGDAAIISLSAGSEFKLENNLLTAFVGSFNVVNNSDEPLVIPMTFLDKITPVTIMPHSAAQFTVRQGDYYSIHGTVTQGSIVLNDKTISGNNMEFVAASSGYWYLGGIAQAVKLAIREKEGGPAVTAAVMGAADSAPKADQSTTKDYTDTGLPQSAVDSVGGSSGGSGVGTPVEATSQTEVGTGGMLNVATPLDTLSNAYGFVDGNKINSYQAGSIDSLGRNRRGVGESGSTSTGAVSWTRWLPNTGPSETVNIMTGQWEATDTGATTSTHLIAATGVTNRPLSGTADYNLAGSTLPTITGSNATGTLDSGLLRVDFDSNRAGLELGLTAGGSTWEISTPGGIASTSTHGMLLRPAGFGDDLMSGTIGGMNGVAIGVTQDGSACTSCAASINGFIAGDGANSAGFAYHISPTGSVTPSTGSITGAAGFESIPIPPL